jgi:uncharacterized protein
MAVLEFQELRFKKINDIVSVEFLDNYRFEIGKEDLEKIGKYSIAANGKCLDFEGITEEKARNKFNVLLNEGFENLINIVTKKKTLYIHKYSGIPLIGTTNFGIIDRNNNMIEVRPLTGCNMNCIFCSVDEGLASKKTSEVVIEEEYLADEVKKLVESKQCTCQIIINSQGEPTLYAPLPKLIKDLRAIETVNEISIVTNGTYLTEKLIDELADAGLSLLNISLNAIDPKVGRIMEGHGGYDIEKVKKMAKYAAKKKKGMKVSLNPVIVGGYNDKEMEKIVLFAKEIGVNTAMQNYLYYKRGRNPLNAEQMPWEKFYDELKRLEEKHGTRLILSEEDYEIEKTKPLPKPFKKGQKVTAEIIGQGRYPEEIIVSAKNRIITIPRYDGKKEKGKVLVKILSDKHNIFYGEVLK